MTEKTSSKNNNKSEEKKNSPQKEDATNNQAAETMPDMRPGDTVRVYQTIQETNPKGEIKERLQYFEGLVLAMKHGKEAGGSITVRKIADGIGVEKIFPLHLPTITKIEIKKRTKVRRAKLNFLKDSKKKYKKRLRNVPLKA